MSVQKFDHKGSKTLITGMSGSGKTTLFLELDRKEKARWKFYYDHQGELSLKLKVPPVFDEAGLYEATARGGRVVFDPVRMANLPEIKERSQKEERAGTQIVFEIFCEYVFSISENFKGRKLIYCDELQKMVSTRDEPSELLVCLDTGRRYQLDAILLCPSPNRIHNAIRNQLTEVYTFRQSDANALSFLSENGFEEDRVRSLAKGQWLYRNLDTGETQEGGAAF